MAALEDIRTAIADALAQVQGLSAYATAPAQVNPPCAIVAPDSVEYDTDFDGGATYRLPVQFLLSLGDWASAQRALDGFVAHDGTAPAAIYAITSLEARVTGLESYGLTSWATTDYLGARLIVEVIL